MPGVDLAASRLQQLADLVLVVHVGVVGFVVGGLVLVWVGNGLGPSCLNRFVNRRGFRLAHGLAIAVVVAESWLGIACPLTTFEQALRSRAGVAAPNAGEGFIASWLSRLLYYDLPAWVFTLGYSLFGLLVVATWRRFPPRRANDAAPAPDSRRARERPNA